ACRFGAGVEALQGVARLLKASQTLDHRVQLVDREIGLAVDLPIIGLGEKVAHSFTGYTVESGTCDGAGIPESGVVAFAGKNIEKIVVGPHQGKLHAVTIRGLQKALAKAVVKKATVVVAIPVKQDGGDSMIGHSVNAARHLLGVGLVAVAPEWHVRLILPRELHFTRLYQFPFGPALPQFRLIAGVHVI